jgi:hypothetical protein
MSARTRMGLAVGAVLTLTAVAAAIPAGAAGSRAVKCRGTADFCGATVSLAGGVSHRKVTIQLTDTDFGSKPVAVRAIDTTSSSSYAISKAGFTEGGSIYVFTLNAAKSNTHHARLVLLFAAGTKQAVPH